MDNRAGGLMGRLSFFSFICVVVFAPMPIGAGEARPTTGTIEICKSDANGMAGRAFQFSLNRGAPITVKGGGCSDPITTGIGNNLVTELSAAETALKNIKANHVIFKDLAARAITVRVQPGVENGTKVTFFNRLANGLGALTVCKVAGHVSLQGEDFDFTENGGAPFPVAAGTFEAPGCDVARAYPKGTVVEVAELEAIGTAVEAITVSDGRGSDADINARTVKATIGAGVTRVTYTNVPNNPLPGFLGICKTALAGDDQVIGDFQFTVATATETLTKTVAVGTCSDPFAVASGRVTVTEVARNPFHATRIDVLPADRVVSTDVAQQTVVVGVPTSENPADGTLVRFENASLGRINVCRRLMADSGSLTGMSATFDVATSAAGNGTTSLVAPAAGATACKLYPIGLPVGSTVTITQRAKVGVLVVGTEVAPLANDNGSTLTTARVKVGKGIITVTFVNQASGNVEICAVAASSNAASKTFHYSVNGAPPIFVQAGHCAPAQAVPVGTATVAQNPVAGVTLQKVSGAPAGRLLTGPKVNPATVSVVQGGGETAATLTFTNA